jgi:cell wall-associated NlpC family hydrolase
MIEVEVRAAIVAEAYSWIGTPYISNGMIKGRRGGVDCGMLPIAIYSNVGLIPKEFDPRPYPPEWHIHRSEEKYMNYILKFAKEVPGPIERTPLPADFILFKIGLAFAHGAIIVDWPLIIHAIGGDKVTLEDVSKNTTGKRALFNVAQKFFIPKEFST